MKAHSKTHFENENMFLEKWKVINPSLKKEEQASDPHDFTFYGLLSPWLFFWDR